MESWSAYHLSSKAHAASRLQALIRNNASSMIRGEVTTGYLLQRPVILSGAMK